MKDFFKALLYMLFMVVWLPIVIVVVAVFRFADACEMLVYRFKSREKSVKKLKREVANAIDVNRSGWTFDRKRGYTFNGNVNLHHTDFGNIVKNGKLITKFDRICGNFDCSRMILTSMEGFPNEVLGNLNCSDNLLENLLGCPKNIGGNLYCEMNSLTTLMGCPEKINGNFDFSNNMIDNLNFMPKFVYGWVDCHRNKKAFSQDEIRSVCDVKKNIICK